MVDNSRSPPINQQETNAGKQSAFPSQSNQEPITDNSRDPLDNLQTTSPVQLSSVSSQTIRSSSIGSNQDQFINDKKINTMHPQGTRIQPVRQDTASGIQSQLIEQISRRPPPISLVQPKEQQTTMTDNPGQLLPNNVNWSSRISISDSGNEILAKAGINRQGLILKKVVTVSTNDNEVLPTLIAGNAIYDNRGVFLKCSNNQETYLREQEAFEVSNGVI
jgi:hypothetical protein